MFTIILTGLLAVTGLTPVHADPTPTAPGPSDVFIEGQSCSIAWSVDPTGGWTTMNIYLMTGNNYDMVRLATVGTVDGTNPTKTTYSYPCPQVSPHAPIYFYEFSSPASANLTWTTRFTITDSISNIVPAPQATQPGGANIPWGTGTIIGTSASASGSTSSSTASTMASSPAVSTTDSGVSPTDTIGTTSTPAPSTTSTTTPNGAIMGVPSRVLWRAVFSIGVSTFSFTVMF
ncbi:hypothetical protein EDC04DRAFT_2574719 [Pisolithus marmoratus]|nr:hypothetical protein EDC04DRAFT_2574719 [Pisolithus marmoratus]